MSTEVSPPSSTTDPSAVADDAAGCPVGFSNLPADLCPVGLDTPSTMPAAERSAADRFVRRLLFIPDSAGAPTNRQAERVFQRSMLISGIRCFLTYVIFPFVLPALGIITSVGPLIGVTIGSVALVCDVFAIRRFFAADHRWRWHFSAIALAVIGLLTVLVVQDLADLLG
jgi:hypothetical protein